MIKKYAEKYKEIIIYVITIFLSIAFIIGGNQVAKSNRLFASDASTEYGCQKAVVEKMIKRTTSLIEMQGSPTEEDILLIFEAKILTGLKKGDTVVVTQSSSPFSPVQMKEAEIGDKILIYENLDMQSEYDWFMGEYVRIDSLVFLGIIFFILLLIFGRIKGLNTIVSLVFTCLAIFAVFIPSVLAGMNIYFWSILVCVFIVVMTLLVINGANQKSFAAGAGCISGVILTGTLTVYMDNILQLTGLLDEDSVYLLFLNPENPVDLRGVIFAAIIIGAIGAIMDVSMSISSSLLEIRDTSENPSFKMLVKSGFTIGRDIMGTMANTLVLAYIGSSLSVTLLLFAYNTSFLQLINREMIVVEVMQALVGSCGLLFTIPFTTLICATLYAPKQQKSVHTEQEQI